VGNGHPFQLEARQSGMKPGLTSRGPERTGPPHRAAACWPGSHPGAHPALGQPGGRNPTALNGLSKATRAPPPWIRQGGVAIAGGIVTPTGPWLAAGLTKPRPSSRGPLEEVRPGWPKALVALAMAGCALAAPARWALT